MYEKEIENYSNKLREIFFSVYDGIPDKKLYFGL